MNKTRYAEAGVDEPREQDALQRMLPFLRETYKFRKGLGRPCMESGHFANVLDLGKHLGLAITTDGVGTKVLLAEVPEDYFGLAFDCVANNVNDLLCIGAEPIALVDYIGLDIADEALLTEVARGLRDASLVSGISIPGGEIAQVRDLLKSHGDARAFDIVGTAIGLTSLDPSRDDLPQTLDTNLVVAGDAVIGIASSGLHSNGYSLARHALFERGGYHPNDAPPELDGRTLKQALLTPTTIYVPQLLPLLKQLGIIKGVANISGGGLLCLTRLSKSYSFKIHNLPETPRIFSLIQKSGQLSDSDMYAAFNMGTGMVVVAAQSYVESIISHIKATGTSAEVIGTVSAALNPGEILLETVGLLGQGERFSPIK